MNDELSRSMSALLTARRFIDEFAQHWGLDTKELENSMRPRLEQAIGPGLGLDVPLEQIQSLLKPLALKFRDDVLRPILQELHRWLRAQLTSAFGFIPAALREDALARTLESLVCRHWRPVWSSEPGRDYLRRYARKTAVRNAIRAVFEDQRRFLPFDREVEVSHQGTAADPESELLQAIDNHNRLLVEDLLKVWSVLRDLLGLTRAEARAVLRSLTPEPMAGMTKAEAQAFYKALQRAKQRLRERAPLLADARPHARMSEPCACTVEHSEWRGQFQVVNGSESGVLLEGPEASLGFRAGSTVVITLHRRTPAVRGARCVWISVADGKTRVALAFHRQLLPRDCRACL